MTGRRSRLLLSAAALALLAAPARAQDSRQLSDLQRQVRELRAIVFQGRDTGQPVIVKPEGPDPQVTALQTKVDTQDQQIRDLTGRVEVLNHDLDELRRGQEQLKADDAAQRQALADRMAKLEGELTAAPPVTAAPVAAPDAAPPPAAAAPPPAEPRPRGSEITAKVQAQDAGRLGGGAAPAPAADSFEAAQAAYQAGDYATAAGGFQAYVATHPTGARSAEARYYAGQSLYARGSYPEAARAYAEALRGWPKAGWAADATVKLAQALVQADRAPQACQALAEYGRRYAAGAPAAVRARAAATRQRAACGAG